MKPSDPAPLKVALITQDEPFAVPVLLTELLGRRAEAIAAVFIVPPTSKRESFAALLRRWWRTFGPTAFMRYGARYVRAKLLGPHPAAIALRHGVCACEVADVNAPSFHDLLQQMEIDLVISVACPQIFRDALLQLPPRGCINVHSGPLPRYRGQLPTFWALYHQERETAVTVHCMNAKLDDGPIIMQRCVAIAPDETQESLMRRCKQVGGQMLAEVIGIFEHGEVPTLPNDASQATYYSFPSPTEAREFRARGGRWL